jgi:hypothetical protein
MLRTRYIRVNQQYTMARSPLPSAAAASVSLFFWLLYAAGQSYAPTLHKMAQ